MSEQPIPPHPVESYRERILEALEQNYAIEADQLELVVITIKAVPMVPEEVSA